MYMIALWGSSGAGKTTLTLALAAAFAKKRQDTLILSAETRTPALPVMAPTDIKKMDRRNSIGPLLETPVTSEEQLAERIWRRRDSKEIFYMGYAPGETPSITYQTPARNAALSLFQLLMQLNRFSYVLVDCDSSPLFDQTTLAALEYAHTGVIAITPDPKGFAFFKSQTSWLSNGDAFHLERFKKVAAPCFPYSPMAEVRLDYGGLDCELPYSEEVAKKMMSGELLSGFETMEGVIYENRIKQLAMLLEEEASNIG